MGDVQYAKIMQNPGGFVVRKTVDGVTVWIPPDEANADYGAFLAWMAEGNEPEIIPAE